MPCVRRELLLDWIFPPSGWVKLNSDGACKGNPGLTRGGGVIRDSCGIWLATYATNLSIGTSVKAEVLALLKGLQTAWDNNFRKIIAEVTQR